MESAQTDEIYAESEPRAMKHVPIVRNGLGRDQVAWRSGLL